MALHGELQQRPDLRDVFTVAVLLAICVGLFVALEVSLSALVLASATLGGLVGGVGEYVYLVAGVGQRLNYDEASLNTVAVVMTLAVVVGTVSAAVLDFVWLELVFLGVWFVLATRDRWRGAILYTAVFRAVWHGLDVFFPVGPGVVIGLLAGTLLVAAALYPYTSDTGGQTETSQVG